jgi:hypothetical protein
MQRTRLRFLILGSVFAILSCARAVLAAQSCNQIDVVAGSTATVSVLLPDTAQNVQSQVTARDTGESKPVDPWGPCPTTAPFGACTPATHAGIQTLTSNTILDPGDGMQLIGFQVKNAAGGPTRTVRLCVQYK